MKWEELKQQGEVPIARSSHSVTVVGDTVYLFGGEHVPRTPIDSVLHAFNITSHHWSRVAAEGSPPTPRVGHTAVRVGTAVYVFGGRSAKEVGEGSLNDLHRFDTTTNAWTEEGLDADGRPEPRSFHAMASDGDKNLYVFGGCGKDGRLNDLWRFDTREGRWSQLPSGKDVQARGGAGLAVSTATDSVYVVGGFCGREMGDVHRFGLASGAWACPECCKGDETYLPPRSVFGIAPHACLAASCDHRGHLVVYGGEVDPSTQGHDGAGGFSSDVLCSDARGPWHALAPSGCTPMPRGWFASCTLESGDLLIHGGNSATNERLADMHILRLH